MKVNLNLGIGYTLLPFLSWNPSRSLSAWTRLKRQFTVVCGICSTIATTMKKGNAWKTRNAPYRFCVAVPKTIRLYAIAAVIY